MSLLKLGSWSESLINGDLGRKLSAMSASSLVMVSRIAIPCYVQSVLFVQTLNVNASIQLSAHPKMPHLVRMHLTTSFCVSRHCQMSTTWLQSSNPSSLLNIRVSL